MEIKIKKYLYDIHQSIQLIESYLGDEKRFDIYDQTPILQDAVERNLEIIGEAVNSILKIKSDIAISNARRMVDTRNKISHGYDEIDNAQIWNIIINHLPLLKKEVENLLQ